MEKKVEIKLLFWGIILILFTGVIIWAVKNKTINPKAAPDYPAGFSISPSVGTFGIDKIYTAQIMIEGKKIETSGARAIVKYDPSSVEIIDENPNTSEVEIKTEGLYPIYYENEVDAKEGIIRIAGEKRKNDPAIVLNSQVVFASFSFRPQKAGTINFNFDFKNGKLNDSNIFKDYGKAGQEDVLYKVTNGNYEVF